MSTPTTSTELVIVPELEESKELAALNPESRLTLKQTFVPYFVELKTLIKESESIAINSPKAAGKMRLKIRKVRTSCEKARKQAGEDALLYKRSVDGIYKILEIEADKIETRMENIEKQEEIAAKERADKLKAARLAELTPFAMVTSTDLTFYDLSGLPEAQYQSLLSTTKAAADAKVAADKKVEEDRIAAEQARLAREKELAAENTRLAKEAQERQKALDAERAKVEQERKKAQAEADRLKKEADAKLAKERAENEAKLAAERKAAADKAAKEKAEREAIEKAAQAKRDAEAKKLADERAKADAKAKAERDALAKQAEDARKAAQKLADEAKAREDAKKAQRANEAEAAKLAAAAPDKAKLISFAKMVRNLEQINPVLSTPAGAKLRATITQQVEKFAKWVEAEASKL